MIQMSRREFAVWVTAGTFLVGAGQGAGQVVKKKKPPVEIVSPKVDGKVKRLQRLEGKLNDSGGWPVIVVEAPNGKLYLQPTVDEIKGDGSFSRIIYIGDADTPPGTKFVVTVCLLESFGAADSLFEQAKKKDPDEVVLKAMPGLPENRSQATPVVR